MSVDLSRLGPDSFRRNAFAILGLATNAQRRRINSARNSLVAAVSMEDGQELLRQRRIGGLAGPADEPTLRDAVQRLQEPGMRLLEELLWFRTADDGEERLECLRGGNHAATAEVVEEWHDAEQSGDSDSATHNLAVFYHALAVELETRIAAELGQKGHNPAVIEALRDEADLCWNMALLRWRRLLASPQFWQWVGARLQAIGAGRLDEATTIAQLRKEFPAALLTITGELMVRSFDRRRGDADRLRRAINDGALSKEALDAALKRLAQPAIERSRSLTDAFNKRLDAADASAKKQADRVTDQYLAECEPLLNLADWLTSTGDASLKDIHDGFARAANRGQVVAWDANDGSNSEWCVEVLRRALPHAQAPDLKKMINNNLEAMLCHFCPQEPNKAESKAHAYKIQVHRINSFQIDGQTIEIGTLERAPKHLAREITGVLRDRRGPKSVGYAQATISVPRCRECAGKSRAHGVERHKFVREQLDAGWKIGSEPSQTEIELLHLEITRRCSL